MIATGGALVDQDEGSLDWITRILGIKSTEDEEDLIISSKGFEVSMNDDYCKFD